LVTFGLWAATGVLGVGSCAVPSGRWLSVSVGRHRQVVYRKVGERLMEHNQIRDRVTYTRVGELTFVRAV
jgi:hypothetical protein